MVISDGYRLGANVLTNRSPYLTITLITDRN